MAIAFVSSTVSFLGSSRSSLIPLFTNPNPMAETLRRRAVGITPTVPQSAPSTRERRINVISMAALKASESKKQGKIRKLLNGPKGAFVAIGLHLATATLFLRIAEGWTFLDALYFSVVIATTVGYGDIVPLRAVTKIFVSLYAVLSVALIGGMLQSLVERLSETQSDIATSAANRLLRYSTDSNTDDSHQGPSAENDLIQATRIAVVRARARLQATLAMLFFACFSGAILYGKFLQTSFVDLFYFLCVSMTTVGLGDIHPISRVGKAYAAIWLVLTSLGFANILSQYANLRLKERERDQIERTLSDDLGEKMFSEIDGNSDGTLSEAEFLGYMLCKLGKASPDEVRLLSFQKHFSKIMQLWRTLTIQTRSNIHVIY